MSTDKIKMLIAELERLEQVKTALRELVAQADAEITEASEGSHGFYLSDADEEVLRTGSHPKVPKNDRNATTQVPCPWCDGHGLVTPEKRTEWKTTYPELSKKPGEVA